VAGVVAAAVGQGSANAVRDFAGLLAMVAEEHRLEILRATAKLRLECDNLQIEVKRLRAPSHLLVPGPGRRISDRPSYVAQTDSCFTECSNRDSNESVTNDIARLMSDNDVLVYENNAEHIKEVVEAVMARTSTRQQSSDGGDVVGLVLTSLKTWNLRRCLQSFRTLPVAHPSGRFVNVWRPLTFAAVLCAVTLGPFDIGFYWWEGPKVYKMFSFMLDIFFLMDMCVNFNVAYIHEGHLVTDRLAIAKNYATTWLLLDLVSNFPYDWLVGSEGKSRKLVKFLKVPKMFRFIKLLRALKESTHYIGVSLSFFSLILVSHYYSCMWAFVLLSDCEHEQACPLVRSAYFEGLALSLAALTGADSTQRIGTSNGLGAIRGNGPLTPEEDVMAASLSIVGWVLCSVFFATTASAIKAKSAVARIRARMLQRRRREMKLSKIPKHLESKVEDTYEHLWQCASSERNGMLHDTELSLDLRRSLALHVYGPALRKVPMMQDMPERCLKCLAQKVEVRAYTSGDMLMLYGEVGAELFIIQTGVVQPVRQDGLPLRECFLGAGCVIGEIAFLYPGLRRTASIRCVEFCTALVLTVDAFEELRLMDLLEGLRAQAAAMSKEYVNVCNAPSRSPPRSRAATWEIEGDVSPDSETLEREPSVAIRSRRPSFGKTVGPLSLEPVPVPCEKELERDVSPDSETLEREPSVAIRSRRPSFGNNVGPLSMEPVPVPCEKDSETLQGVPSVAVRSRRPAFGKSVGPLPLEPVPEPCEKEGVVPAQASAPEPDSDAFTDSDVSAI